MKVEIDNKKLEKALSDISENTNIPMEYLIKKILEEYISENYKEESIIIDKSVSTIKAEAKILGELVTSLVTNFENKYEVTAEINEATDYKYINQPSLKSYIIKVGI